MRILIAEDDTDIRSYLVAVCEAFGHSVTECDTGPSAWREFEREPYDIVILDRMMPGFEGLEVDQIPISSQLQVWTKTTKLQPDWMLESMITSTSLFPKSFSAIDF